MALTYAAYYGAIFAPAEDVRLDVVQGPTGAEITGTLIVTGGSGDATEDKQDEILSTLLHIGLNAKIAAQNGQS